MFTITKKEKALLRSAFKSVKVCFINTKQRKALAWTDFKESLSFKPSIFFVTIGNYSSFCSKENIFCDRYLNNEKITVDRWSSSFVKIRKTRWYQERKSVSRFPRIKFSVFRCWGQRNAIYQWHLLIEKRYFSFFFYPLSLFFVVVFVFHFD